MQKEFGLVDEYKTVAPDSPKDVDDDVGEEPLARAQMNELSVLQEDDAEPVAQVLAQRLDLEFIHPVRGNRDIAFAR